MSRPATASYWYPSSVSHLASPRRYCAKLGECNISSLRHPDGASNPNLKEEIERIPGNGASGSDPEEEYIEAKKLFATTERTVTGKSDIEEDPKTTGEDFVKTILIIQHSFTVKFNMILNKINWIFSTSSSSNINPKLGTLIRTDAKKDPESGFFLWN